MFILRSLVVVLTAKLTGLGNAVSTEGNLAPRLEARGSPFSTREIDDRSSDSSIVYNTPVTYFVAENGTITGQVAGKVGGDELIVLSTEAADAVSIAAIEGFGKITQAVCTSAGPFACAAVGLTAVIAIFFGVFVLNGRDIMESGSEFFPMMLEYPPITGCGVACRLHREAPEGDWRSIGNVTVNGTFHDIHFKKMNGLHGLRALQFSPLSKRAEDNEGGMVFDYHWMSDSEWAYDSFHSTQSQIQSFGELAAEILFDVDTLVACCDFGDSDGELDGGLLSVGWNNQPFLFNQDGEEQGFLNECNAEGAGLT